MFTLFLTLQIIVTFLLITVVLLQKSDGGGLGIGTSESKLFSARGTANLLTRATAVLGTLFFVLSLSLAVISKPDANFQRLFAPSNPSSGPSGLPSDGASPDAGGGTSPTVPFFTPEDIESLNSSPDQNDSDATPSDAVPLAN